MLVGFICAYGTIVSFMVCGCSGRIGPRVPHPTFILDRSNACQASMSKDLAVIVELFAFEIGQFEVAPVVQSRSFGSITPTDAASQIVAASLRSPRRCRQPVAACPMMQTNDWI